MKNVSDKICGEIQASNFMFNNYFFFRKFYRLSDNVEKYGTAGQATDGACVFACRTNKAKNTHSQYVTIIALSIQQWLHEYT
jgi:hypothetical protein